MEDISGPKQRICTIQKLNRFKEKHAFCVKVNTIR